MSKVAFLLASALLCSVPGILCLDPLPLSFPREGCSDQQIGVNPGAKLLPGIRARHESWATKTKAYFITKLGHEKRSQNGLCFLQHPTTMGLGRHVVRQLAVFSQEPTPISVCAKLQELQQDEMLAAPIFFMSLLTFWSL